MENDLQTRKQNLKATLDTKIKEVKELQRALSRLENKHLDKPGIYWGRYRDDDFHTLAVVHGATDPVYYLQESFLDRDQCRDDCVTSMEPGAVEICKSKLYSLIRSNINDLKMSRGE